MSYGGRRRSDPPMRSHWVDGGGLLRQTSLIVTRSTDDLERKSALAAAAIRRAIERCAAGTRMQWTKLPASKHEFPKLLCLDQNKWIDLARAHYDQAGGAAFKESLGSVRRGVAARKLIVPVTGANLCEVAEPADEARRERLARFMVDLSGNQALVIPPIVLHEELRSAVLRHFIHRSPESPIRPALLQRGMFTAVTGKRLVVATGDVDRDRLVSDAMCDPEISVLALTGAIDRETVEQFREADNRGAEVVEQIRKADAHLSLDKRRTLELSNLLTGQGSTAAALSKVLRELGVAVDAFHGWLREDDHLGIFANAVPGIDVTASLMLHRDVNMEHRTHRNDGKDFSFMRIAIPYGNMVVAEKSWTHFARTSGLAERYETVMETDARKLPELLAAAGCLT
jgi:hypothetical protein